MNSADYYIRFFLLLQRQNQVLTAIFAEVSLQIGVDALQEKGRYLCEKKLIFFDVGRQ